MSYPLVEGGKYVIDIPPEWSHFCTKSGIIEVTLKDISGSMMRHWAQSVTPQMDLHSVQNGLSGLELFHWRMNDKNTCRRYSKVPLV